MDETELTTADLETYTQGRLVADDPNTCTYLNAALSYVRAHCRWHVTPIENNVTMTLDGPGQWGGLSVGLGGLYFAGGSYMTGVLRRARTGSDTLFLPTKRLISILSISENGVELDLSSVAFSQTGEVVKTNNELWTPSVAGSNGTLSGGIQVTFTHGYDTVAAADWRRVVLAIADRTSMVRGLTGPFTTSVGPYRVNAYFGESRTGTLPLAAGWLDDLLSQLDTRRYVRVDV